MTTKRTKDIGSLLAAVVSDYVLVVPLIVAIVAYIFGVTVSPDIDTDVQHARWTGFFGTAAQVTATLLVVLAVEGKLAAGTALMPKRGGALLTVLYIAVGLIAAVGALSPSLSDDAYCQLFAFTVAGGVGALFSVVLIAARSLSLAYTARDDAFREQVGELWAAVETAKKSGPA
jgi:hypothetical protein